MQLDTGRGERKGDRDSLNSKNELAKLLILREL
jgi:hypothetical protein